MNRMQDDVMRERQALNIKLGRLGPFIGGVVYYSLPKDEQLRLKEQFYCMRKYLRILDDRIAHFTEGK